MMRNHWLAILVLGLMLPWLAVTSCTQASRTEIIHRRDTTVEALQKLADAQTAEAAAREEERLRVRLADELERAERMAALEEMREAQASTRDQMTFSQLGYKAVDPAPQLVMDVDSQFRILWINSAGQTMLGRTLQELAGRSPDEVLPISLRSLRAAGEAALTYDDLPGEPLILRLRPAMGGGFAVDDRVEPGTTSVYATRWKDTTNYRVTVTPSRVVVDAEADAREPDPEETP